MPGRTDERRAAPAPRRLAPGDAACRPAHRATRRCGSSARSTTTAATPTRCSRAVSLEEKRDACIRQALGRPEAAARGGVRARRRSGAALPRRADHRPRPAVAPPAVGPDRRVPARRAHGAPHDALHGRGRATVRPRRRSSITARSSRSARRASSSRRSAGKQVIEFTLAGRRRRARPRSMAGLPGVHGARRTASTFSLTVEPLHVALPALRRPPARVEPAPRAPRHPPRDARGRVRVAHRRGLRD